MELAPFYEQQWKYRRSTFLIRIIEARVESYFRTWCIYENKGRFPLLFFAFFVVSLIFDWIMSSSKKRGKHCAVFGCNNNYYNDEGLFDGYHFFKFPTSPKRRNRWCNLIKRQQGRDGFTVTSSTVVCNEHFKQEDIVRKLSGRFTVKSPESHLARSHVARNI